MLRSLPIEEFILQMPHGVVLDVRTPAEFEKAHIPGARNLPLFTNEERAIIGTIYKQQGRQPAILKGLDLIGPRMKEIVKAAEAIAGANKIYLYCWRGGMRSGSVGWLLDLYGFDVFVLKRGYKAFRNYALVSFNEARNILVLSGKTGSGKTLVLHELTKLGEPMIDLEGMAHHKGSAFGTIGQIDNCSQEHFENKLAMAWINAKDSATKVWIEDESRSIGRKILPEGVWNQIREAHVVNLEVPLENRIDFLVSEYGKCTKEELLESTLKIMTRLGGLAYKMVFEAIENNKLDVAAGILLGYYDKAYRYGMEKRDSATIHHYKTDEKDYLKIAMELVKFKKQIPE